MRTLSDRAAKAWLVLWRDTKPNGLAKAAISDLARRMGCSAATAKRALAELKKLKLLEIEYRGGLGRGPSAYRLTL
jgi:Mn-dependent DtxR family transcriptional regulator